MQGSHDIVSKVKSYSTNTLSDKLPDCVIYHSIQHTEDVVESALEIAEEQRFSDEDKEIIEIAAWFHDLGYTTSMERHEEDGAEMARDFLKERNYPEDRIEKVAGCILATKMPQNPKNPLEKVLCDADMMHLAKGDYFKKADMLHREIQVTKSCVISDLEWLKLNSEFLSKHRFFTEYARNKYGASVKANLDKVREKLKKWAKPTK